jgi:deferrochelatase/peroxidase EfeB
MTIDRRKFLTRSGVGIAATAAGALGSGLLPRTSDADATGASSDGGYGGPGGGVPDGPSLRAIPFHGDHQAGVLNAAQSNATFAAFDVTATSRAGLAELMRTLTSRARFLTAGGVPSNLAVSEPPSDSGTLGPVIPPDGLSITVGVGETLFDDRFGLASQRPAHLTTMEAFPNDDLDPDWCGGDLILQICAGEADAVAHAIRDIARHTRGAMALRWKMNGLISPARPDGKSRNFLGFKDGIANPSVQDPAVARRLLWAADDGQEPAWTAGGTYHVCRLIRTYVEFWDRVSLNEQQGMFGRFRDTGIVLGDTSPNAVPDYKRDPHGKTIPLTAHIRLANPRTPATEESRIYRRGYNYDLGVDLNGNLNVGLVFNCFQQNIKRQFDATQKRLLNEALSDYIAPFGGGYFFTLPGVQHSKDWYLRRLLA